ncbi:MAG TPA: PP2C family serine/threonine-protein phosphatase [Ktedonobacteraceae bacterium]|nr:PP2C family serine/threonine-protein phosphatase [Ktedonobacteraceae bacterium]
MSQQRISRHNHINITGSASEAKPFVFARHTVACERHPNRNEDSFIIEENSGLAAVFDGVGGSAAGEIASLTAAQSTRQSWKRILLQIQKGRKVHSLLEDCGKTDLCKILEQIISEADERVRTDGARRAGTSDLATTVAMSVFCREKDKRGYTMVYAHVGDSRAYLLRNNEALKRLTNDDGLLAKLVENEVVNDADALRIDQAMHTHQLSDTEYSYFRLRGGITQALGGPQPPAIHSAQVTVFPGDRILLCTDGIHDNLIDEEIEEILRTSTRTSAARLLVERSVQRSHQERDVTIRAKPDDMSAIVMTCRY